MMKFPGMRMNPKCCWSSENAMPAINPQPAPRRDISQPDNSEFLRRFGYDTEDPYKAVGALIRRFRDFPCPHEIGLFLGYPLEDVRGFIDYKGACYKYAGLWKVYGDVENSKRIFKRYKQCTESLCRRLSAGASMDDLIA